MIKYILNQFIRTHKYKKKLTFYKFQKYSIYFLKTNKNQNFRISEYLQNYKHFPPINPYCYL